MSHSAALTMTAIDLVPGRNSAKRLSRLMECSYRTVQDWRAQRRRMCLDHAIELAARNDAFRAALMARIDDARGTNEVSNRQAADLVGGQDAGLRGSQSGQGVDGGQYRPAADRDASRVASCWGDALSGPVRGPGR